MRREVRRATRQEAQAGGVPGEIEKPKRTAPSDEELVELLRISKLEYATAFIQARTSGTEIEPGRKATVEDARMWARRNLITRQQTGEHVDDPEVVRWRLIVRFGSPAMSED